MIVAKGIKEKQEGEGEGEREKETPRRRSRRVDEGSSSSSQENGENQAQSQLQPHYEQPYHQQLAQQRSPFMVNADTLMPCFVYILVHSDLFIPQTLFEYMERHLPEYFCSGLFYYFNSSSLLFISRQKNGKIILPLFVLF